MERGTYFGILLSCLLGMLSLLALLSQTQHDVSAAMIGCDANGGDRREQNRIDAVRLTATTSNSPPQVILNWQPHPNATGYRVYRKTRDATAWGSPTALGVVHQYSDAIALGDAYEYRVERIASGCSNQSGYIYAGVERAVVDQRGKLILLVDNRFTTSLAVELARLEQDLRGDGWQVIRHDVSSTDSVVNVKALISAEYSNDPTNVKSVFLFGHIPVPYSGDHAVDYHELRAWPADIYYADMDGTWTDSSINRPGTINPNVPNDGVYDQAQLVASASGSDNTPELAIGRVDLYDLPIFSESETELLRRYLDKDHAYRHKQISVRQRGWISDKLGGDYGWETPGIGMWTSMVPLVGSDVYASDSVLPSKMDGIYRSQFHPSPTAFVEASDPIYGSNANSAEPNYDEHGFIFADANSTGNYDNMSGSGSAGDYAYLDPPVIFNIMFGSRFGDWDSQNNLLRATLAQKTYGLGSAWSSWGAWQFHHMALGEPIGHSVVASHNATVRTNGQNLYELYDYTLYNGVNDTYTTPEMSLMGDPTLRMHIVEPPSNLTATVDSGVHLSWSAPSESVLGYHVYRASAGATLFTRLTSEPITTTSYDDYSLQESQTTYVVKAVTLEQSPSGSYYNTSQGAFTTTGSSVIWLPLAVNMQAARSNAAAAEPMIITLFTVLSIITGILYD